MVWVVGLLAGAVKNPLDLGSFVSGLTMTWFKLAWFWLYLIELNLIEIEGFFRLVLGFGLS